MRIPRVSPPQIGAMDCNGGMPLPWDTAPGHVRAGYGLVLPGLRSGPRRLANRRPVSEIAFVPLG